VCVSEKQADAYPLKDDITSTERFINRSKKIRKGCYAFLRLQVGQTFDDLQDLADTCSNAIAQKPNPETCKRWIRALCAKNGDFELSDQPAGLVIRLRERDEGQ